MNITDEELIELLKSESPFFIKDIINKYGDKHGISQGTLWNFLNMKYNAIFKSELVREGIRGRPKYKWSVA